MHSFQPCLNRCKTRYTPHRPVSRRGTATIEFVMVLPVLLILILLTLQFMLVMVGRLYVQYAAYAAARTAIVQIPQDYLDNTGEGVNEIQPYAEADGKMAVIRHAACWALVPVSGRADSTQNPIGNRGSELVDALNQAYAEGGASVPNWVEGMVVDKTNYAFEYTEVMLLAYDDVRGDEIYFQEILDFHTYAPQDSVTVQVRHQLALTVPYIRALFQDGENDSGPYTDVTALTTLTNEGVDPTLPPETSLPRDPQ